MTHVLITGATGLIGGAVLQRILRQRLDVHAYVLVRDPVRWYAQLQRLGISTARVTPLSGDITAPRLGIERVLYAMLRARTDIIVHCAADTTFSQTLEHARAINRDGTARVLELASEVTALQRFVYVSTAFVAGRLTGEIAEAVVFPRDWVNAYEQSKHEAEQLVRASRVPWLIARPSTVVCDGGDGRISQRNAVHRAVALCRAGLAAMIPGEASTGVDVVTTDYVAGALARLTLGAGVTRATYHLCAGTGALPLGELLDRSFAQWSRDARWRRRGVVRPALAQLSTYELFERTIAETGDTRLRAITRSLGHFAPQLALPKQFATQRADDAVGFGAPVVASYWAALLEQMDRARQHCSRRLVA